MKYKGKICDSCYNYKYYNEFYIKKSNTDNYENKCKECRKTEINKRRRSKEGVALKIFQTQNESFLKRKYKHPVLYTKDELRNWLFNQPLYHELYNKWVKSNYKKDLKPSVDRINDYKDYSFDNIQLMTWGGNRKKLYSDIKNGINNKQSKAVLQFDLENNFIKEYYSASQAGRENGFCISFISSICNNKYKQGYGFIWKYKNN